MFGPPEPEAGRRTVAIPPHVLGDVKAHLDATGTAPRRAWFRHSGSDARSTVAGYLVLPSNGNTPCVLPCAAPQRFVPLPDIPAPAGGRW